MRLNQSQKLRIAERHLKEGIPIHELSKELGYDAAKIKYICALYRRYRREAFADKGESRVYTRAQKLDAIKRHLAGESSFSIGVDLMLGNPDTVCDWEEIYLERGEAAVKDTHSRSHYLLHEDRLDRVAGKKLMERLEYLEAENDYLKKLYSLAQKGSGRPKRK